MTGVKAWGALKKENEHQKNKICSLQHLTLTVADHLESQLRFTAAKEEVTWLLTIVNTLEVSYRRKKRYSEGARARSETAQPSQRSNRAGATRPSIVRRRSPTPFLVRPPLPLPPLPPMRRMSLPTLSTPLEIVTNDEDVPFGPVLVPGWDLHDQSEDKVSEEVYSTEEEGDTNETNLGDEASSEDFVDQANQAEETVLDESSGCFGPVDEPLEEVVVPGWDTRPDSEQDDEYPVENEENGGYTEHDEYEPCDGDSTDEEESDDCSGYDWDTEEDNYDDDGYG